MSRYLNKSETQQLSHTTGLSIEINKLDANSLKDDFKDAYENLKYGNDNYIKPLNDSIIAGYKLVKIKRFLMYLINGE